MGRFPDWLHQTPERAAAGSTKGVVRSGSKRVRLRRDDVGISDDDADKWETPRSTRSLIPWPQATAAKEKMADKVLEEDLMKTSRFGRCLPCLRRLRQESGLADDWRPSEGWTAAAEENADASKKPPLAAKKLKASKKAAAWCNGAKEQLPRTFTGRPFQHHRDCKPGCTNCLGTNNWLDCWAIILAVFLRLSRFCLGGASAFFLRRFGFYVPWTTGMNGSSSHTTTLLQDECHGLDKT